MTLNAIEGILCDYADALDVTAQHHRELTHCHGWKSAIAEEVLAAMACELVRLAKELTGCEFIQSLASSTGPVMEIP